MADGGHAGVPLRRMRGDIHAVELLDDVLELVCDELLHVTERRDLDVRREMTARVARDPRRRADVIPWRRPCDCEMNRQHGSAAIRKHWRRKVRDWRSIDSTSGRYIDDTTRFGGIASCLGMASPATYCCTDVKETRARSPAELDCAIVGFACRSHTHDTRTPAAHRCMFALLDIRRSTYAIVAAVLHVVIRSRYALVIECRMQDDISEQMVANQNPIGVFDPGVGGLSVLQALRQELPHEHFCTLATPDARLTAIVSGVRDRTCYHYYELPRGCRCKGGCGCVQHGDGDRGRVPSGALRRSHRGDRAGCETRRHRARGRASSASSRRRVRCRART